MLLPAVRETLVGHITHCQICGESALERIFSLGHHPPVHGHLTEEMLHEPEITYPLNWCRCPRCGLLQLDFAVDPRILFSEEYPYHTGMTMMLVRACRALAEQMTRSLHLGNADLAVDIGSNDGTLLQGFKELGVRTLGVEPSGVAKVAQRRGIPTMQDFFTERVARAIVAQYGHAKVITATNVFAHVNNLYELLAGIDALLDPEGVFVSDSQYLMDIVGKLELDTIYHEHLRFYALRPLLEMCARAGMSLVDAERTNAAGGSIRVFIMRGNHPQSVRMQALLKDEDDAGLSRREVYDEFASRAIRAAQRLRALLLACKEEGARIAGVGAPARSNTLLNFARIGPDLLSYAGERAGSPKIGLYTPGMHIPVVDEARIVEEQPEYALILSWHIGEELMSKLREKGYRGRFIMPLPEPRIVTDV